MFDTNHSIVIIKDFLTYTDQFSWDNSGRQLSESVEADGLQESEQWRHRKSRFRRKKRLRQVPVRQPETSVLEFRVRLRSRIRSGLGQRILLQAFAGFDEHRGWRQVVRVPVRCWPARVRHWRWGQGSSQSHCKRSVDKNDFFIDFIIIINAHITQEWKLIANTAMT